MNRNIRATVTLKTKIVTILTIDKLFPRFLKDKVFGLWATEGDQILAHHEWHP